MSDSEEESLVFSSSAVNYYLLQCRQRNYSVHPINVDRNKYGEYHHLYRDLRQHPDKFVEYMRMQIETFDYISSSISQSLEKKWKNCHGRPISVEERLMLTLRYLSTGQSFRSLDFSFRMGVTTVSKIIAEVVQVIWEVLQPQHMKIPDENDFKRIADDFYNLWNFPNCLGTIDGKHVKIFCPEHSGSMYFNYKKHFSIVLQGLVDANYKFTSIDVGNYGKQSDGGTFRSSALFLKLSTGELNIPNDKPLPNSNITVPYVMIGDEAYPLLPHLMKPFSRDNFLQADESYYNYRLSRARRTVECAFGILFAKWRLLATSIQTYVELADYIVKCICLLHNLIIDREGMQHNLQEVKHVPPISVRNRTSTGRPDERAKKIRNLYKLYFCKNPL